MVELYAPNVVSKSNQNDQKTENLQRNLHRRLFSLMILVLLQFKSSLTFVDVLALLQFLFIDLQIAICDTVVHQLHASEILVSPLFSSTVSNDKDVVGERGSRRRGGTNFTQVIF